MSTNRIINGWHCDVCGRATIVVHVDLGVTPMLLRCRATPGCAGVGRSLGYPPFTPPQAVLDLVELEWALPSVTQMKAWKRAHDPMYDHVLADGLVLRPLTDAGRRVLDTLRPAPEPEPAPAAAPDVEIDVRRLIVAADRDPLMNPRLVDNLRTAAWVCREHGIPMTGSVVDEGAAELARLRRREQQWAADVVWRANWMTRAVNVLGEIREQLEHELTETGHLATIEQLLADEFEDGAGDE